MTQTERVRRALVRAGARGITAVDFAAPSTVDGGPPIMRVGARVHELRREGLNIADHGRRDKCVVYVLRAAETQATVTMPTGPASPSGSAPGSPEPSLFPDTVGRRNPMFDTEEAA